MKKVCLTLGLIMVCAVFAITLTGCGSLFKGDKGDAGVSLLKTYTGTMTGATRQVISVPEILANPETTFVLAYQAFASNPDRWTPITDGWLDSTAMCIEVDWVNGNVNIYQGFTSSLYKIKVYKNI